MAWDVSRRFQVTHLYITSSWPLLRWICFQRRRCLNLALSQSPCLSLQLTGQVLSRVSNRFPETDGICDLGACEPTWGRVPVFHQQSAVRCPSLSLCGMPQSRGTVRKSFVFLRSRCARHGIYLFICVLFPSSFFRTLDCLGTLLRGPSNSPLLLGSFSSLRSMMPGHHGGRIQSSYKGGYYR